MPWLRRNRAWILRIEGERAEHPTALRIPEGTVGEFVVVDQAQIERNPLPLVLGSRLVHPEETCGAR
jgi:hypothetical protein